MKATEKVTIRIKKKYVYMLIFFVIILITIISISNIYKEYEKARPAPLDDIENIRLIQFEEHSGASAVVSTTAGDMTFTLFEEEAPNAAVIFRKAVSDNSFGGVVIQLYEQGTVFTADAPDVNENYSMEYHKNLWPFKGALCMNETGDLIFINTVEFSDEDREYLSAEGELSEVRGAFLEHGGIPNYSRQFTVLGQVTEGMDVLEKIAASPQTNIITINEISITE